MKWRLAVAFGATSAFLLSSCGSAAGTSSTVAPSQRVLIMLTQGPDPAAQSVYTNEQLWRINLAISLANRSLNAGRRTTLFLDVHAPVLARKDLSPALRFNSEPPIKQQLADFIAHGGTVLICPLCAETMHVREGDIVGGATYDDSQIFESEGLAPGAVSLSF